MENILDSLLPLWKKYAQENSLEWKRSFCQWNLPATVEADFSLNLALKVAHRIQRPVEEVAKEILDLTKDNQHLIGQISQQGYINFRLTDNYYYLFLKELLASPRLAWPLKKEPVLLEYVSANPTGYLHLAHLRHAIIGNTLANIYEFFGFPVIREYYINNQGKQINSFLHSVHYFYQKLLGLSPKEKEIEYSGQASQDLANQLKEKWGSRYLQTNLKKKEWVLWKREVLELALAKISQDLKKCGVDFNVWFWESSLYHYQQPQKLLEKLQKKDLIYSQAGSFFFRTTLGVDDKDRVIIKENGDYTYFFSDLLYHQNKIKRTKRLINIWGADHHGTAPRLKSAWQLLGYDPQTLQIVLVQTVSLLTPAGKSQRFSKRAGNQIELTEALNYVELDQLRFFLLEKEINQPLTINLQLLAQSQEKTLLYYIQYAHARCQQLLLKAQKEKIDESWLKVAFLPWKKEERKILKSLLHFFSLIQLIVEENQPHHLIHYLINLAREFQAYYQKETIIQTSSLARTQQKLLVVKGVKKILQTGLELAGITAPEKM